MTSRNNWQLNDRIFLIIDKFYGALQNSHQNSNFTSHQSKKVQIKNEKYHKNKYKSGKSEKKQ